MRSLVVSAISFLFLASSVFASTGGGGVVRPGMALLHAPAHIDLDQSIEVDSAGRGVDFVQAIKKDNEGRIVFKYKAFDNPKIEIYAEFSDDMSDAYKEALTSSEFHRTWIPVLVK